MDKARKNNNHSWYRVQQDTIMGGKGKDMIYGGLLSDQIYGGAGKGRSSFCVCVWRLDGKKDARNSIFTSLPQHRCVLIKFSSSNLENAWTFVTLFIRLDVSMHSN